eukprot:TRINITY_DN2230_c0_g1_i1.p1 TRINITY_DN2230_c0_g1~~TRINITY_DN2230_c0_g1_i1.p1  ORF type:complete len:139 (+),score=15.78 TRINITY_DN2230_c0_g1_i1:424-840(+)
MWAVNVHALGLCSQYALPLMTEQAIILNVSSKSGWTVGSGGGFYAPTKFAVRAMTLALRNELRGSGSQVRVAAVSPGYVDTPMLSREYFADRQNELEQIKEKMTMLSADDVADSIMHVLKTPPHVDISDITLTCVGQT